MKGKLITVFAVVFLVTMTVPLSVSADHWCDYLGKGWQWMDNDECGNPEHCEFRNACRPGSLNYQIQQAQARQGQPAAYPAAYGQLPQVLPAVQEPERPPKVFTGWGDLEGERVFLGEILSHDEYVARYGPRYQHGYSSQVSGAFDIYSGTIAVYDYPVFAGEAPQASLGTVTQDNLKQIVFALGTRLVPQQFAQYELRGSYTIVGEKVKTKGFAPWQLLYGGLYGGWYGGLLFDNVYVYEAAAALGRGGLVSASKSTRTVQATLFLELVYRKTGETVFMDAGIGQVTMDEASYANIFGLYQSSIAYPTAQPVAHAMVKAISFARPTPTPGQKALAETKGELEAAEAEIKAVEENKKLEDKLKKAQERLAKLKDP